MTACSVQSSSSENKTGEKTETQIHNKTSVEADKGQSNGKGEIETGEGKQETSLSPNTVESKYRLNPANWSLQPISGAESKVVLLTFDDAPDKYSLSIATTLKKHGVKAIFFVNGHFLDTEAEKAVLKEIHDMGFAIGNHTYNHAALKDLTEEDQENEIVALNDAVEAITGERPRFFRAPFGLNTEFSKQVAAKEKMLVMNWTFGYDWEKEYQNKRALSNIMVHSPYLTNGANLLMHDRKWTSDAISTIVTDLAREGYGILDPALIETP
ncbi:polysaccharide deacetylase family protein [Bacillus sp. V5-8f]|uniref:polysaccharide deacetylase family protein n=1 Tax=Bacillus sp. V5-8f TaxID=2053044 RepID=UPI002155EE2C|nr:polysaccharide deacetylase family protein [Bacillus sp. V5-8f]